MLETYTFEVYGWKKKNIGDWRLGEIILHWLKSLLVSDTYLQRKHKPHIILPNPTYTVLCVTRYFKDNNREQKVFYTPKAVALEGKDLLFPLKHEAKV